MNSDPSPQEEFDLMSDDPFIYEGDYVLPNGNSTTQKIESKPVEALENFAQDTRKLLGRRKRKSFTNHNARSIEYYEKQGYLVFKVEGRKVVGGGMSNPIDFLGLFDFMAIKVGCPDIGIQVCALTDTAPHLSKMTSTQLTSFNNRARIANLRSWLETGHRAVILGWAKPGSRWEATEREIDLAYVEKAEARKRKA